MMDYSDLVCNGTTRVCVDFFKKHYDCFKPIKRISTYFNNANFLLSPYTLDNSAITMVLENRDEETMQLSGTNCGYSGEGPNGTREILEIIGVSRELALSWMKEKSLIIDFEENGEIFKNDSYDFFGTNNWNGFKMPFCKLDDCTFVSVINRTVHMIAPAVNNIHSYFNCLEVMRPIKIKYRIGNADMDIEPIVDFGRLKEMVKRTSINTGIYKPIINLSVIGEIFDVVCCLTENEIAPLVNATNLFLLKKPIEDSVIRYYCGGNTLKTKMSKCFGIKSKAHVGTITVCKKYNKINIA